MRIRINDFNFRGKHYEGWEFDMPQLSKLEDFPWDRFKELISETLTEALAREEES